MPSGQVIYYSAFEGALGLEDEGICTKCIFFQ
jgi:hypothetical protein